MCSSPDSINDFKKNSFVYFYHSLAGVLAPVHHWSLGQCQEPAPSAFDPTLEGTKTCISAGRSVLHCASFSLPPSLGPNPRSREPWHWEETWCHWLLQSLANTASPAEPLGSLKRIPGVYLLTTMDFDRFSCSCFLAGHAGISCQFLTALSLGVKWKTSSAWSIDRFERQCMLPIPAKNPF